MERVPLVDKDKLPENYEILEKESDKLHKNMNAEWWRNQATLRTYGNNIELAKTHVSTNVSLWAQNGLTPEETEYVILSVAKSLGSEYIWHDHVIAALERSDMPVEHLLAFAKNETEKLPKKDQVLIEYSQNFVEDAGNVRDDIYEEMIKYYDNRQVVGATMTAAYYIFIEYTARALHIPRKKDFLGWELEKYDY